MHARATALLAASLLLVVPATAAADYPHVVTPGETLTSVAKVDGLSVSALAAANGVSSYAQLIAGTVLEIPPRTAYTNAGSPAVSRTPARSETTQSAAGGGSYVVQFGDTLTAIAARAGTTVSQLAALNGLNPDGILLAGATLTLPGGGTAGTTESSETEEVSESADRTTPAAPAGGNESASAQAGAPYPTQQYVSAAEVANIAAANGVPAALAEAIGWQESGFNNDLVSVTGAVGVMQIEPGTWRFINRYLASGGLAPASATDNVRAGVLLLHDLLARTGSDSEAAAAYFQGLASVRAQGMLPSTQQYVASVLALEHHFGG
jgi:N-acetylmuramoyl-L-alanine amidase